MKSRLLHFLLTISSVVFANDNYPRNENIDIKHYTFEINLNDSTNVIGGIANVEIRFKNAINEFELDLTSKNAEEKGMIVSEITMDGKKINFTHTGDRIMITLPEKSQRSQLKKFTVKYSGIPADGLIISKNKYGDRTFFGDNWPNRAHNWLPTIDHPYDKASVDFIVSAPAHYTVVGCGVRLEESSIPGDRKITHWHEDADLPTKVMVIGVARFAIEKSGEVNGIPVEAWVYPQNRTEGFSDYSPAVRVLDFFIGHVGEYSYKKLANVQSTTIYGGMENASNIFYYENSVTGEGKVESLIAHEVAHQWFGDSASEDDWHHVWLSEGFATYFTHLYNEFTYGVDFRRNEMKEDRVNIINFYKKSPAPIVDTSITNLVKLLNTNSYQKGGWVLHMLRHKIGDENFWLGIRTYYETYMNGNALSEDLQRIMEEVSGQDLDTFFKQWLYRAGMPVLSGTWKYNQGTKSVDFVINQVQKEEPFVASLEVAFYGEDGITISVETIPLDGKTIKKSIKMGQKPVKIELDPGTNLLFDGNISN